MRERRVIDEGEKKGEMDFCNSLYINKIAQTKGGIRPKCKKHFEKRLP